MWRREKGALIGRKEKEGATMTETLMSLSHHNWKNAKYIMKKVLQNEERWSCKGEFIHYREAVKGSHMIDLVKHVML